MRWLKHTLFVSAVFGAGCGPLDLGQAPTSLVTNSDLTLDCPQGADLKKSEGKAVVTVWCERPDGVRDGKIRGTWVGKGPYLAGEFCGGTPCGHWTRWYPEGQMIQDVVFSPTDGVTKLKEWYKNGQPRLEEEGREGRASGPVRTWYPNGQLSQEGLCSDGKRDGVWRSWTDAGVLSSQGTWKDGIRDGAWTLWWDDGSLWESGNRRDGKRVGAWTFGSNETAERVVCTFENGEIPPGPMVEVEGQFVESMVQPIECWNHVEDDIYAYPHNYTGLRPRDSGDCP